MKTTTIIIILVAIILALVIVIFTQINNAKLIRQYRPGSGQYTNVTLETNSKRAAINAGLDNAGIRYVFARVIDAAARKIEEKKQYIFYIEYWED